MRDSLAAVLGQLRLDTIRDVLRFLTSHREVDVGGEVTVLGVHAVGQSDNADAMDLSSLLECRVVEQVAGQAVELPRDQHVELAVAHRREHGSEVRAFDARPRRRAGVGVFLDDEVAALRRVLSAVLALPGGGRLVLLGHREARVDRGPHLAHLDDMHVRIPLV